MAGSVLVDAGFLVAFLSDRDNHHGWALTQSSHLALPWKTCESVLSEAFHILGQDGRLALASLIRRSAVICAFTLADHQDPVLNLMRKYADTPMSLADACLVRMTEVLPDPTVLTTDAHFRIYRRHSRQVVPCSMPY
jgi:predicted nucleic acid-binding protein